MTGSKLQKKLSSPLLISEIFSRRSWTIFLSFCIIDFNFLLKISPRWSISVNKIYINYRMFNVIQLLHYPQKEISFTLPRRRFIRDEKRKRLTSTLEFISSSSETETSTAFLNVGLSFEKLRFFFIKKGKM